MTPIAADGDARGQSLLVTARSLAVDGVTAEVVRAFAGQGIRSMLIKGPTIATWLYDDGSARYYLDSDLWVEPARFDAAQDTLTSLGFERGKAPVAVPKGAQPHAEAWVRPADRADVDLHRALSGVGVAPEEAWELLTAMATQMSVGGEQVTVPPIPVRALLVALHAAQHGIDKPKPLEDLSRALRKTPPDTWAEAARIAVLLDATPGLAYGLRLVPEGAELAGRLGLVSNHLVERATREGSTARVALGLQRLADTPTLRERIRLLRREFVPSPAFLRWWSPLARRGMLGLAAAYVWRPVWLLLHAGPSLLGWMRSRGAEHR